MKRVIKQKRDMKKEKPFLMREPIYAEGRTWIEKIEYWLFKKRVGSQKSFCNLTDEIVDNIDLDVKDIQIKPKKQK